MQTRHLLLCSAMLVLASNGRCEELNKSNEAAESRMKKDIYYLASAECEGRGVSTKGIGLAGDHIAAAFKAAGLKPGGINETYFQPFPIRGMPKLLTPNSLEFHGMGAPTTVKFSEQFRVSGMSNQGKVDAEIAFVGFGATAKKIGYDDYEGIDVKDKVVVILRKTPKNAKGFDGASKDYHAGLSTKVANAEAHKAAAVLLVNDLESAGGDDRLLDFTYSQFDTAAKIPVFQVKRSIVSDLFKSAGRHSLDDFEKAIDESLKPASFIVPGYKADLVCTVDRGAVTARNVIGYLDGAGSLAEEIVVIGAHYDHLGYGGFGSLARNIKEPTIHYGADDNGSGTTMLLEEARRFAAKPNRQGRKMVFMAFSGEEMGLLGSAYYCNKDPLFPLNKTVAMINMDMVGRLRPDKETNKDKLIVYGTGSAKPFDAMIESLNQKYQFTLKKIPTGMGPSDQQSFYLKDIPVYFFFTEEHPDYHKPTDTPEKINLAGMAKIANLVEELATQLESMPRPEFVKVTSGTTARPRVQGPRVGIRPAYGDEKEGVLLSGVTEDTPAQRAGLKEGDRIMAIDGKLTANLESYMSLVAGYKKGDSFELTVLRGGKKVPVKVKLD